MFSFFNVFSNTNGEDDQGQIEYQAFEDYEANITDRNFNIAMDSITNNLNTTQYLGNPNNKKYLERQYLGVIYQLIEFKQFSTCKNLSTPEKKIFVYSIYVTLDDLLNQLRSKPTNDLITMQINNISELKQRMDTTSRHFTPSESSSNRLNSN